MATPLVRFGRGGGEVPGAAVGVRVGGEHPGECLVHGDALMMGRLLVGGGADQRMPKRQAVGGYRDEIGVFGGPEIGGREPERGPHAQDGIDARTGIGRRDQQQCACSRRQFGDLGPEALLYTTSHGERADLVHRVGVPRAFGGPARHAEFDERQRITGRLGQHPFTAGHGQPRCALGEQSQGRRARETTQAQRFDARGGER